MNRHAMPRVFFASSLLSLALIAGAATADLRGSIFKEPAQVQAPSATDAICTIGQSGPLGSTLFLSSAWSNLKLYQLLDPAACPQCPASSGGLLLTQAVIRMRFRSACSMVLRVSVVEATGAGNCVAPDTTHLICPPQLFTLSEAAASVTKDYLMPLASGCCLTRKAFLVVEIVSQSCGADQYAYANMLNCTPCSQYFVMPGTVDTITDNCDATTGLGFDFDLRVNADCCSVTPAMPRSWGRVKNLYR